MRTPEQEQLYSMRQRITQLVRNNNALTTQVQELLALLDEKDREIEEWKTVARANAEYAGKIDRTDGLSNPVEQSELTTK
jgi:hypothetical protein